MDRVVTGTEMPTLERVGPTRVRDEHGRELVFFGGCDYLCLSQHPSVIEAMRAGAARWGASAGASRTTTGNHPEHASLEREVAAFLGVEAALLLPDGYTANMAACQALRFLGVDIARAHPRAHPSLTDAARSAGLGSARWESGGTAGLAQGVLTDGVFTGDGSIAPVRALVDSLGASDRLIVDDCHGFAVLGAGGRGTCNEAGVRDARVIITTTLAKGLGAAGGVVAGAWEVVEAARRTSAFVCTTPIGPALAGAARAALRVLGAEPERVARLRTNSALLRAAIRAASVDIADATTPVGVIPYEGDRPDEAYDAMRCAGVLAPVIRYPGGPSPWYFRLAAMSEHTERDFEHLTRALRACPVLKWGVTHRSSWLMPQIVAFRLREALSLDGDVAFFLDADRAAVGADLPALHIDECAGDEQGDGGDAEEGGVHVGQ